MALKVGELAERTGLTVRTLHHYDEIGLLRPARRSLAGHRLYEHEEIVRLQQIRGLQQLGFTLDEIGDLLAAPDYSPLGIVRQQLERMRDRLAEQEMLIARLERLASGLEDRREPSTDEFLATIEAMTMFDKYYTPEQLETLAKRREQVGEERIRAVQQEWQELYEQARVEMEKGTNPADEAAQALVRKWRKLIEEFTGGDAGIAASLAELRRKEPSVREKYGPPPEVAEFLRKAAETGSG